jgi:hypothetical protein
MKASLETPGMPARRAPLWLLALLGGVLGQALWLWDEGRRGDPEPTPADLPHLSRFESETIPDLSRAPPRVLRTLPAIGEQRAIEIARARWLLRPGGPPLALSQVPGVGEETERRVQRWLEGISLTDRPASGSGGAAEGIRSPPPLPPDELGTHSPPVP